MSYKEKSDVRTLGIGIRCSAGEKEFFMKYASINNLSFSDIARYILIDFMTSSRDLPSELLEYGELRVKEIKREAVRESINIIEQGLFQVTLLENSLAKLNKIKAPLSSIKFLIEKSIINILKNPLPHKEEIWVFSRFKEILRSYRVFYYLQSMAKRLTFNVKSGFVYSIININRDVIIRKIPTKAKRLEKLPMRPTMKLVEHKTKYASEIRFEEV